MYDPESTRHRASEGFSAISGVQNLLVVDSTFNLDQRHIAPHQKQPSTDYLRKVADWLTSINFGVIQSDTFSKHTPGTGTWFVDHPQFQKWLSGNNQVLWVEGMPGSGKTILASIVTEHLQAHFCDDYGIAVVFAYCRYADRYPLTSFLASFIKQLVERHPRVFPYIDSVYTKHQKEATRPHEQNLLEIFQKLVGLFKQAYIIIDAVDEASDDTRDHLLRALLPLRANLLLTSRPSNLSKHLPQDALFVYIDALNQQDIKHFIDQKFEQSTRISGLLKGKEERGKEICAELTEKSNGMFLAAALQIESLQNCQGVSGTLMPDTGVGGGGPLGDH